MQLQAIYYATAIAIEVKDFDLANPIHSQLKATLESKSFIQGDNNIWMRKSFRGWDNYLFWKNEVEQLIEYYLRKPEQRNQEQFQAELRGKSPSSEPPNLEKIGEKIKKLLALSQSPNEAEAISAFSKAQEILTRYNLSLADLADEAPQEVEEQIIDQSKRQSTWKGILLNAVASANYCLAFNRKSRNSTESIILGRKVNIQSAQMQFEYLVQAIERLATEEIGDACDRQSLRAFKNAFKLGAAQRLQIRIIESIEQQKREGISACGDAAQVSAIVMRSLYERLEAELKAYTATNLNLKFRNSRPCCNSADGFAAGQSAGNKISLNKQVGMEKQRYLPG
ncbi:DUF2786 domain-containing protein [Komarekiella sp. 'clone 1']|uniref:DUF2786 domain-containing protein n=1 Tax=Komarekiella delphini-convector SJRDD-AB1 TaxID=2593771 RepID=A0AA40T3X0_9NOST|nr:DUF2786 domain-containing protein [Komarekiella delphini-convector]MBD6620169.1 DUF2786 domain-containing protein [Komarekiella delphini-convector SJRDD-AB1]